MHELNGDDDVWIRDTGYYNSGYPLISTIDYSVYVQYVPMTTPDRPIGAAEFSQTEYAVDISMFMQIDTEVELTQADIEWYSSDENGRAACSGAAELSGTDRGRTGRAGLPVSGRSQNRLWKCRQQRGSLRIDNIGDRLPPCRRAGNAGF